jgi:tRNA pseudouridine38-40 synthase
MPRYALEVRYDGTRFHGSQLQGALPTVQRALNDALSILFREAIHTYGASRTDEGVHALCNYYHFDVPTPPAFDLLYKCNAILPDGVAITRILEAANPEFNCRFEATARLYRYRIYRHKDPFLTDRALYYPYPTDKARLDEMAATVMRHTHFESFAKRNSQSKTFICTITRSEWEEHDDELHYIVEANRFLRGMVRGLVATQLRLAREQFASADLEHIIAANDCTKAFFNVPGHGLYLERITYPPGTFKL